MQYHDLEFALHLLNLILGLDEVLAVQVAVSPHSLVQVLLLLQPRLPLHNLQYAHPMPQPELLTAQNAALVFRGLKRCRPSNEAGAGWVGQ